MALFIDFGSEASYSLITVGHRRVRNYLLMEQEQPQQTIEKQPDQVEGIEPVASDVDFAHVRGLMYTLVTVCVFCASILVGPDEQILPADGNMSIPVFDLEINKGSFLYIGPILIVCISIYTYLFLLKILARVKAGLVSSDQYIFTMQYPAAQIATYCIFFWLPAVMLFLFSYKTLPRPESVILLGISLIFLISIVAIQLKIRVYKLGFLMTIFVSMLCVVLVLFGFREDGWLKDLRMKLHSTKLMTLENANLANRDLRNVDIRNVQATSIILNGADLRGAVIKEADLRHAKLEGANLRNANVECTRLTNAKLIEADLTNATFTNTYFGRAEFVGAKLNRAKFLKLGPEQGADADGKCKNGVKNTHFLEAKLQKADLSKAKFNEVIFRKSDLSGAILKNTDMIGAKFMGGTLFKEYDGQKASLKKADLRCSHLKKAIMDKATLESAKLGGTDLTQASLNYVNLTDANLNRLSCSVECIKTYIDAPSDAPGDAPICTSGEKRSQLSGTKLAFANLKNASFIGANLNDADLRGANLDGVDLTDATIEDTNLLLARLSAVEGLDCTKLDTAKYWEASIRVGPRPLECGQEVVNFEKFDAKLLLGNRNTLRDFRNTLEEFTLFEAVARGKETAEREGNAQLEEGVGREGRTKKGRRKAPLEDARMSKTYLSHFKLNGIWLIGAQLDEAKLNGTQFKGARLARANLQNAKLVKADLRDAVLNSADLTGADLQGADLENANLQGTILKGADLKGANLRGVKGLGKKEQVCVNLQSAKNWEQSFRDDKYWCGVKPPKGPFIKTTMVDQ